MADQPPKHILGTFENALGRLRDDLLVMGSLAVRNLANSMNGLSRRDDQLCRLTIADDEELDEMEKRVDQDGFQLMLRFQPVASDLRAVISAMKISGNLERVGDLSVSIARRARRLILTEPIPEALVLEPLFDHALAMLKDSLRAFSDNDVPLSMAIKNRDAQLDLLAAEATEKFTMRMEKGGPVIADYLNLIFIARHLERIGDHAKNIAEDNVFAAAAEDIRHAPQKKQH